MRDRRFGWLGAVLLGGGLAFMVAGAALGDRTRTTWGVGSMTGVGGMGPGMMGVGGMGPGMMGGYGVPGASALPPGSSGPTPSAHAGTTEVRMAGSRFAPLDITVSVGASVTWINDDSLPHTATATDRSWSSGNLAPGDRYSRAFAVAGTYPYVCIYHPWMRGTITVTVTQ